ncbi:MAG: hypothetical protein KDK91_00680 [Gammaproteobacteria bacterium]|nr:hypothetical protein [Gammaproteobacteria bacterium]
MAPFDLVEGLVVWSTGLEGRRNALVVSRLIGSRMWRRKAGFRAWVWRMSVRTRRARFKVRMPTGLHVGN